MNYKFIKVQSKSLPDNTEAKGYWLFCPQTEEQLMEHWNKYVKSVISDGSRKLTKKIFSGTKGHFTNDFEQAVEVWMNSTNDSLMVSMVRIENEAFQNRLRMFRSGREIYLSHSIQVVTVDTRFVDILTTTERNVLTFPDEDKPEMKDVRFIVWEGGVHYYAKIGKLDIVDKDGNQKWNTRAEAESAARWYINQYW